MGAYGQSVIPDSAHIRVAAPRSNDGQALLRRGYSFADGVDPESGELDAGLYFICFQKDPRTQFIPIQRRLAETDALSQYLLPTGSGIFACPPGPAPGRTWGQALFCRNGGGSYRGGCRRSMKRCCESATKPYPSYNPWASRVPSTIRSTSANAASATTDATMALPRPFPR